MKFLYLICISFSICILALSSCKKQKVESEIFTPSNLANGVLVLNEGLFQQNNASISFVDWATSKTNGLFFEQRTGRPLGDTGNDMQKHDGKLFIIMNVSSTIEILNAHTGAPIKQIAMVQNGIPKQPRYIAFDEENAYISCYDGFVDVLNLNSLTITNRIPVGANPEQLVVVNEKLYVSNSGGLNFPNLDSTVSVVSLALQTEIAKISVGKNPGAMAVDSDGDIYVISRGDFASTPSRLHRISSLTDTKVQTFSFSPEQICLKNTDLIVAYSVVSATKLLVLNTLTETISNNDFGDLSAIQTFYGMFFSNSKNRLYCFDAQGYVNSGFLIEYDSDGNFIKKYTVGLNPNHILLYD